MFQRPLTLIVLKKSRDTNGRRIVIQIGGVYTTFCQEGAILLPHYLNVATPAEPRGGKKFVFVQTLGGEKLLKLVEKCR